MGRIYQGQAHIPEGRSNGGYSIWRGGGTSDSPLQRSSVSNKLHLDLHAGVLVPGSSQMFIYYDCRLFSRPVRQGGCSAVDRFYVLCRIASSGSGYWKCAMQCMTKLWPIEPLTECLDYW